MKRKNTARTVMITSTMALTLALGGSMFSQAAASANPAANAGISGSTPSGNVATDDSDHSRSKERKKDQQFGLGRHTEELASILGITQDELQSARHSGKSIADIAAEQNVDPGTVIDKLVAIYQDELKEQLGNGKITQVQYDGRIANLPEQVTAIVNSTRMQSRSGHEQRHGRSGDSDSSTAAESDGSAEE